VFHTFGGRSSRIDVESSCSSWWDRHPRIESGAGSACRGFGGWFSYRQARRLSHQSRQKHVIELTKWMTQGVS